MEGWIKLHRKIVLNPFYFSEPFTRSQAWIDLLILANHSDNFFYKRGIKVDVKTGQVGYDLENLAVRWKWSRGKAERFFCALENTQQIVRQKTNVTTLISIVNYQLYQSTDKPNGKANSNPSSKANGQQTVKQTDTNKNEENVNNEKKELIFDTFRKLYPGTKKGNETEFDNFKKKQKDWELILPTLEGIIKKQIETRKLKKESGQFVPEWKNLQTWINQSCWEEEIGGIETPISKKTLEEQNKFVHNYINGIE